MTRAKKPITQKIPLEAAEQRALVAWLKYHPVLKNYFCKIPNDGKRSVVAGAHSKLEGLRPGVSDLFIYYPTKTYAGLWLEVKRNMVYPPSAMKTPTWISQEEFKKVVEGVGYSAKTCYGWEDGKNIISVYLQS